MGARQPAVRQTQREPRRSLLDAATCRALLGASNDDLLHARKRVPRRRCVQMLAIQCHIQEGSARRLASPSVIVIDLRDRLGRHGGSLQECWSVNDDGTISSHQQRRDARRGSCSPTFMRGHPSSCGSWGVPISRAQCLLLELQGTRGKGSLRSARQAQLRLSTIDGLQAIDEITCRGFVTRL